MFFLMLFFYHFGYKKTANYLGIPIFFCVFFDFRLDPVEDEPVLEWFYDPVSWPSHDWGTPKKTFQNRGFAGPTYPEWKWKDDFFFPIFFWCWILWMFFFGGNSAVLCRCMLYVESEIFHVPFSFTWTGCASIYSFFLCKSKNWNQAWNYIFFYTHIISLKQLWQVTPNNHFRSK